MTSANALQCVHVSRNRLIVLCPGGQKILFTIISVSLIPNPAFSILFEWYTVNEAISIAKAVAISVGRGGMASSASLIPSICTSCVVVNLNFLQNSDARVSKKAPDRYSFIFIVFNGP